ncbi:MAG: flagellar filament capping protein FliD [Zoogloeaceae bacterium]|jgi:flagellar hook-associated protein 2|nr:flagellar filament capping protein FliD [Zoogloeaceae bacterium]
MPITSLGVGSGLDLQWMLDELIKIEKLPGQVLQKQATSYRSKISALGTLSSKLGALQAATKAMIPDAPKGESPAQKFASYSGSLGDEKIGTVTIGDGAVSGNYALDVKELASAQKILSNALTDSDVAGATGNKIILSAGTLAGGGFTADTKRRAEIEITAEINTVEKLRNAINKATKDTGVSASVINDGSGGKRLVLSGNKDGSTQAFQIESDSGSGPSTTSGFLAYNPVTGTPGFKTQQKAVDAKFVLDGVTITSKGNTVSGVLDGVTLQLAGTGATQLKVVRDDAKSVKAALEKFVSTFNDAARTMNTQGAYDAETKVAGPLQGNNILREAQSALRTLVFGTQSGENQLSDIGIAFGSDGTLRFDAQKLDAAITKDPNAVAELAAKVGKTFSDRIDKIIGAKGSIQTSTDGMNASIRDLEKRKEALDTRVLAVEARYRKQFTALDTMLSKMNSTSNYLAQQLTAIANIPKTSSKK